MRSTFRNNLHHFMMTTACVAAVAVATPAAAQTKAFDVPAQSASKAIPTFARQAGIQILASNKILTGKRANAVKGNYSVEEGLALLLRGTGLRAGAADPRTGIIVISQATQAGQAGTTTQVAAGNSVVTGTVVDAQTGSKLEGALVEIVGSDRRIATDEYGYFRIGGLAAGTYEVRVSYLGYAPQVTSVSISDNSSPVQIALGDSATQEIVVYGRRSARAKELNQERTAANVSTVISSDMLGDFTGTTISEALRRAPGVSFDRNPDTGDGANIGVRGLTADLNTVKLNGVELPETSGTGRSADLSNILTESISKVTISKTLLPSQDSSGTGGLVEIETKSPLDRPRRFVSLNVQGAKKGNGFSKDFLVSGTASARFGAEEQFGLSVSAQYRDRSLKKVQYEIPGFFSEYLPKLPDGTFGVFGDFMLDPRIAFPVEPGADRLYPQSIRINRDETSTENLAINVAAAWKPSDNLSFNLDYQLAHQETQNYASSWDFFPYISYEVLPVQELRGDLRNSLTWSSLSAFGLPRNAFKPNEKRNTDILSFKASWNPDAWRIKLNTGYTRGSSQSDYRSIDALYDGVVFTEDMLLPEMIDPIEGRRLSAFAPRRPNDKSFPRLLLNEAGFATVNDPRLYQLAAATESRAIGENSRYVAEGSVAYDFSDSVLKSLTVGTLFERSKFSDGITRAVLYYPNSSANTLGDFGVMLDSAALRDVGIESNVNLVSLGQFRSFFDRLPTLPSAQIFTSFPEIDPRLSEEYVSEQELAPFFEVAMSSGPFEMVAGVRWSQVQINSTALLGPRLFDSDFREDLEFFRANSLLSAEKVTQRDWLPRALINYRPNDNLVMRLGYYKSVARPQISLLSKTPTVLLFQANTSGPLGNLKYLEVTKGNPDLKPASTDSFDFSAEYYFHDAGVIKFGAFYKSISNFLQNNVSSGAGALEDAKAVIPDHPAFADVAANPADYFVRVSVPQNSDSRAKIWGFELSAEKRLTFMPGALSNLSLYANYTYTDSSRQAPLRWDYSPVTSSDGTVTGFKTEEFLIDGVNFNGQPKHSGTIGLAYTSKKFEMNLGYSYQSRRLVSFLGNNLSEYEEAYGTLDARLEYRLNVGTGDARFYVEGADLLRGPHGSSFDNSRGADDGVTGKYYSRARYFGGRQVRVGLRASF